RTSTTISAAASAHRQAKCVPRRWRGADPSEVPTEAGASADSALSVDGYGCTDERVAVVKRMRRADGESDLAIVITEPATEDAVAGAEGLGDVERSNRARGARIGATIDPVQSILQLAEIHGIGRDCSGREIMQRRRRAARIQRRAGMGGAVVLHSVARCGRYREELAAVDGVGAARRNRTRCDIGQDTFA